jgi:hypothetical protein
MAAETADQREYKMRLKREREMLEDMISNTKAMLFWMKLHCPKGYAEIVQFICNETVH